MIADAVDNGMVNVYNDADLTKDCGQVDGSRLQITARKVKGESIYGTYRSGDRRERAGFQSRFL